MIFLLKGYYLTIILSTTLAPEDHIGLFYLKGSDTVLTAKEEKFCLNVASGMTLTDAYKNSYNAENMLDKTINEKACILAKKDKIKARIEELRDKASNEAIMSAIERKEWLTQQIKDLGNNLNDRLKAVDILNKMSGEYITKIDADVQTEIVVEFGDYEEDQED